MDGRSRVKLQMAQFLHTATFEGALIWVQEVLRRLPVELCQLQKLHHVNAALPGLTFRQEGMRESHVFGNLTLIQPSFFACRNQPLEDRIVLRLKWGRSRFA